MGPKGVCAECGADLFGDGDIALESTGPAGVRRVCMVCFLDVERVRDECERLGLPVDDLKSTPLFETFRGRAIRQRAKREKDR
jgi:hypothetical protein